MAHQKRKKADKSLFSFFGESGGHRDGAFLFWHFIDITYDTHEPSPVSIIII